MKALRLLLISLFLLTGFPVQAAEPQTLDWEALMPADWDPSAAFEQLENDFADLLAPGETASNEAAIDNSPQALALMDMIQMLWDSAPLVQALDGQLVRLPGYGVSLDADAEQVRNFLLVPYFGACIHTPPPPRNQIVLVEMQGQGVPLDRVYGAMWVTGTLSVNPTKTEYGQAGYVLQARQALPYE